MNKIMEPPLNTNRNIKLLTGAGFKLLPVMPASKRCLMKCWPELATHDPVEARRMFRQWRGCLIGGLMGVDRIAVDVDRLTPEARELLAELPPTMTAATPHGEHRIFALPGGTSVGTRLGLVPGIDLKAARSYIVLPSGPGREWIDWRPMECAPQWLIELAGKPRERHTSIDQASWPRGPKREPVPTIGRGVELMMNPNPSVPQRHTLYRVAACAGRFLGSSGRYDAEVTFEALCDAAVDMPELRRGDPWELEAAAPIIAAGISDGLTAHQDEIEAALFSSCFVGPGKALKQSPREVTTNRYTARH